MLPSQILMGRCNEIGILQLEIHCARNHVITYTNKILPTDRFHLVTDTNQNLEFMKLNPFAGKQSKDIDS